MMGKLAVLMVVGALLFGAPASAQTDVPALPGLPPLTGPGLTDPGTGQRPQPPAGSTPPAIAPQPGTVGTAPGSVTEGVDVAQTGFFADGHLAPPLRARWSVRGATIQGIVAAEGRVFITQDKRVQARDLTTGKPVWTASAGDRTRGIAYDAGTVFVSIFDDVMAFDAATGAKLWQQHLLDVAFTGAPVASGGVVYVTSGQGGAQLHAFAGRTGAKLWRVPTLDGSDAPALDDGRLYLAGACGWAEALDRRSGGRVWAHPARCTGGGDVTPALYGGRVYNPATGAVLDAAGGAVLAEFSGDMRPVFVDGLAIYARNSGLVAVDPATGARRWRYGGARPPVIAIGHDVYTMRGENLVALDGETGAFLCSARIKGADDSDADVHFAAAPSSLIVSSGNRLTVWESYYKPPDDGLLVVDTGATSGSVGWWGGMLGSSLSPARPKVRVEVAPWRRGAFRPLGSVTPQRDGGFSGRLRINRNVRVRAVAAGKTSKPRVAYAYPKLNFGKTRATRQRNRARMVPIVTAAVPLSGRTIVLYVRRGSKLARLGSGRLARRSRSTFGALVTIRSFNGRKLIWMCIRGQLGIGLGYPDSLTRRCGAPSVPMPRGS